MKINSYIMSTTGLDDPAFADLYVTHGKSAYQAAVEQGFEGTEEEWLLSLCELRFGSLSTFSDNLDKLLYVDIENDQIYRFDATTSKYKAIGAPLGETEKTAYRGDRGKIAYDHSQSDHDFLHRNGGTMIGVINTMNILPKESLLYTLGSNTMLYKALYVNKVYSNDIEIDDGIKTRIMARGDINTYLDTTAEWRRGRYFYTNEGKLITAFDAYGYANNDWEYWTLRDGNSGRDIFKFAKTGVFYVNYSNTRSVKIGNDVSFIDNISSDSSASARGMTWSSVSGDSSTYLGTIGRFTNFGDHTKDYFYMGNDYTDTWLSVHETKMNTRHILPKLDNHYNIGADSYRYANIYALNIYGALKGNADTASAFETGRNITLGLTTKVLDGTKDLTWSLSEIGALPVAGGTVNGTTTFITNSASDKNGDQALIISRINGHERTRIYQYDQGLVFDILNDETVSEVKFIFTADDTENSDGTNAVSGTVEIGVDAVDTYVKAGTFRGNAYTASKLYTPRTINGTSFDGTGNIITQTWGTSRNITISDADGTNKGTAVSVNGSEDEILPLPSTIKATLSGNASSATKLKTARTIAISGKAIGTATAFDGSENVSIPITEIDPSGVTQTSAYRFVTDTQITEWSAKPTKAEMDAAIAALVGAAPDLINTLDELAAALGDDPNFATTMTNALATKLPLAGGTMTGTITSQNVIPGTTNTYTIGSSSYVYKGIYATTFYGALSGNASSATKLATARNFNVTDYSGTNVGATVSFDGTAAVTMKLPDTIKATSFVGALSGNATTASSAAKLTTAVNINGTSFDGSKEITTALWGTARDINISDASGTNSSTAVSVNGSASVTLLLPATIKATLSGNASSATKLKTARNFNVTDYSGTNAGAAVSFDGTAAVTMKLPDTIKATSFVGALSGNADTATKWATARTITLYGSVTGSVSIDGSGNVTLKTNTNHTHSYLPLTGGTLTGALTGTSAEFTGDVLVSGRLNADGRMALSTKGNNWISGMTLSNAAIDITTQNSENSYHPIIAGKTYDGNFWNLGTIRETVGFVGFLKGRTENERDSYMLWSVTTGELQVSGAMTAASFTGAGSGITGLNASNISSGTLNAARLATSGATAGSYGPSANASPSHSGTFSVPYITVDKYGRVTAISTKIITLPGSGNTDTKVTQSNSTTSNFRPLILGATYGADGSAIYDTVTDQVYTGKGIYACPSTASIYATTFVGALSGNANSATKLATARKLTIGATGKNFDGSADVSWSLSDIGAAAASHTHSYAGSSSAGGAATTALACTGNAATATKLATARTITLSGSVTGSVSFDGSGNVTIATTTNHTHSYLALSGGTLTGTLTSRAIAPSANNTYALGTSSMKFSNVYATTFTGALSGNANTATKLATARNITVNLGSTSAASFDGSAAVTPGVSGTLPIANGGTGATTAAGVLTKLGITATATELNYTDGVTSNIQTQLNGKLKGSYASGTTPATAGWYRIATTAKGISNCTAIFQVMTSLSGKHTTATIVASTNYGSKDSSEVSVLQCSQYSASAGISKARIVYHTTYNENYAYLEVYMPNAAATVIYVHMVGGHGWSLVDPKTAGSIPSGYSNKEVELSQGTMIYPIFKGALSGNAATATKLATARTLTIGSKGKTFDGSGNVSWTLAEIGAAAASHTHNYAGSSSAGGSATSAVKLATARTLTIGSKGKTFDGSGNVSWTLAEIGAAAASHTHSYMPLSGGTFTGAIGLLAEQYSDDGSKYGLDCNNSNIIGINGLFFEDATDATTEGINFWKSSGVYDTLYAKAGVLYFHAGRAASAALAGTQILDVGNFKTHVTPAAIGAAASSHTHSYASTSHTHNYAGSSSAGGSATSAVKLATARTLTIGSKGKTFDGSGNVSWTLAEIGAAAASHTHDYAASSHTHKYAGSSSAGGAATSLSYFKTTSTTAVALDDATTNCIAYTTGTSAILSQSDGALYKQVYSSSWIHEIYGDYRTGQIAVRGKNNGTWQAWRTILDTGNFKTHVTPAAIGAAASSHTHSYASTSHTHNYAGSSSAGGDATNALKLGGYSAASAATASTIALRDANGYLFAKYFNQSSSAETPTTSSYIMYANSDGYLRKSSLANIKTILGLGSAAYTASTAYAASSHTHSYAGSSSAGGAATSAVKLSTARTLTIGSKGKTFDGSGNVSWTLAEIGAAASSHTHSYLPLTGGTLTGHTIFAGGTYQSDASIRWGYGAIQIRENGLVGNAQSADAYAPTLGFHWSNITAGQIILGSDGSFKFKNQSDVGAPIQTGLIYSDKGLFDRVIYFKTFTELAASLNAKITTHGEVFGTYYPIYIGPAGTTAVDLGSMTSSSAANPTINQKGAILDFRFCRRLYSTAAGNTSLINGCRLSILNLRLTHTDSSAITVNSKTLISLAITMNMSTGLFANTYLEVSNCDIIYNYTPSSSGTLYTKTIKIDGPSKMANNVINMNSTRTSFSPYAYVVEISTAYAHIISNNTILAYVQSSDASAITSLNVRDSTGSSRRVIIISGNILGTVFLGKLNSGGVYKCSGNFAAGVSGTGNPGTGF